MARLPGPEVVRLAYNGGAGFTSSGDALATAVAIAGWRGSPVPGESGGDPRAEGDTTITTGKWGPSIGLWQIRSLRNPDRYGHPDNLRVQSKLYDPAYNAETAKAIYDSRGGSFRDWSVYTTGIYLANLPAARELVVETLRGEIQEHEPSALDRIVTSGPADAVAGPAERAASALAPVTTAARWVTNPDNWTRIGLGAAGIVLLVAGAILLAREAASPAIGNLLGAVPHPAAQAGAAVASAAEGS